MSPETEHIFTQRGIPRRLWPLLIGGGLRATDATEHASRLREASGGVLVLSGGPGCGKTTAAAALLADTPGRFRRATDLQRAGLYDVKQLAEFFSANLLVLDDVGAEYSDERGVFRSAFDDLVNRRYDACRSTIVTTNLTARAFGERYGQRIIDRIREVGSFVGISRKSMRTKQEPSPKPRIVHPEPDLRPSLEVGEWLRRITNGAS